TRKKRLATGGDLIGFLRTCKPAVRLSTGRMRKTVLLLLVCGCGGDALLRAELADMQKKLDDTQRRAATAERKSEDMQDQVFLLTDKLESQKIAHAAAPRLPVVLLKPEKADDLPDDEIAFEGAAKSKDPAHTRPQLVLNGSAP